jgi:hypothetical protein
MIEEYLARAALDGLVLNSGALARQLLERAVVWNLDLRKLLHDAPIHHDLP